MDNKICKEQTEEEFIIMYQNMSDQCRNDLFANLKIIGRTDSDIAFFRSIYDKYITKKADI
jgi:hypothetical protein